MRPSHLLQLSLLVGALALALVGLAPMTASASVRHSTKLSCKLLSPAILSAALGTKIGKPTSQSAGGTTTCSYPESTGAVIAQFTSNYTMKAFDANLAGDRAHGEKTAPVKGYGNAADTVSFGNVLVGLSVIKGHDGFFISALTSLTHLKAIANQVLPSL